MDSLSTRKDYFLDKVDTLFWGQHVVNSFNREDNWLIHIYETSLLLNAHIPEVERLLERHLEDKGHTLDRDGTWVELYLKGKADTGQVYCPQKRHAMPLSNFWPEKTPGWAVSQKHGRIILWQRCSHSEHSGHLADIHLNLNHSL